MSKISLKFDKGTLLLTGLTLTNNFLAQKLGLCFDERVSMYRAPAYRYRRLREFFQFQNIEFIDEVQVSSLCGFEQECSDANCSVYESLRDYQKAALDLWLHNGKKGIVSLPTGAGKTRLAAAAIEKCSVSVICLVPTIVLMYQWERELRSLFPRVKIGLLGESKFELEPITIATYASALRNASNIGNKFDFLVIDEAHHFGENKSDEILVMSSARYRLALTATLPSQAAHFKRLQSLAGQLMSESLVTDLLGSYLSNYQHDVFPVQMIPIQEKAYNEKQRLYFDTVQAFKSKGIEPSRLEMHRSEKGRVALKALREAKRISNGCAVKMHKISEILLKFPNSKALIFMGSVSAAIDFSGTYFVPLIISEISKTERDTILANFRAGKFAAIATCQVLNEGFDLPETDLVIIAGGSKGKRELKQRIGRALRLKANKIAHIIEVVSAGTFEERVALKPIEGFVRPQRKLNIRGVSSE